MLRGTGYTAIFAVLAVMLFSPIGAAQIPNVNFEIAVRQKEEGKLRQGYHVLNLLCWNNSCSLTWLTLNQCVGNVFYPKIERHTTDDGELKVVDLGDVLLVEQRAADFGGISLTNLRLGYKYDKATKPYGNTIGLITQLTSFSGGFVKQSEAAQQVLTVEYVPLRGLDNRVNFDCPALLSGLP